MKIKFWGVRGSLPTANSLDQNSEHIKHVLRSFIQSGYKTENDIQHFFDSRPITDICGFGQNTTCVQIRDQGNHLLIDGGSGIKVYGDHLMNHHPERDRHHILITHFHYDHIMGLPFFPQHFVQDQEIHYYAVQSECEKMIRSLFSRPLFPLSYENLAAKIHFHQIQPYEKTVVNGFDVTPFKLDHPDPCYGFRVESQGKVYAHAVDHEADRISETELGRDAGLFKSADLLYIDAQYTEPEMEQKKSWGHGTFARAFKICSLYNIKEVLLAHHDPGFTVSDIQKIVDQSKDYFERTSKEQKIENLSWGYAYDGQTAEIKSKK
jgi:phosphoribosyl 1,2-cyclic phosphodiesterase